MMIILLILSLLWLILLITATTTTVGVLSCVYAHPQHPFSLVQVTAAGTTATAFASCYSSCRCSFCSDFLPRHGRQQPRRRRRRRRILLYGHYRPRFFLDSANEQEYKEMLMTTAGLFYGVVTNPAVLLKDKQSCTVETIHRLVNLTSQKQKQQSQQAVSVVCEFLCQTWGTTVEEMVQRGLELSSLSLSSSSHALPNMIIKVPATWMGIQAATQLIQAGCRVGLTAVYHPHQALMAAAIGADYVTVCLGLMNDNSNDNDNHGLKTCLEIHHILQQTQQQYSSLSSSSSSSSSLRTKLLVACIRDSYSLTQLAAAGVSCFALTPEMVRHVFFENQPQTDQTVAFLEQAVILSQRQQQPSLQTTRMEDRNNDKDDKIKQKSQQQFSSSSSSPLSSKFFAAPLSSDRNNNVKNEKDWDTLKQETQQVLETFQRLMWRGRDNNNNNNIKPPTPTSQER